MVKLNFKNAQQIINMGGPWIGDLYINDKYIIDNIMIDFVWQNDTSELIAMVQYSSTGKWLNDIVYNVIIYDSTKQIKYSISTFQNIPKAINFISQQSIEINIKDIVEKYSW